MAPDYVLIESMLPRIRAEYREMPGLRLNAGQARRLWASISPLVKPSWRR